MLINQFYLLILPCRIHRDMTSRRLIGQGRKNGRTALYGEPPGFSVSASY